CSISCPLLFFFYSSSPTEIYTLSLHDALPICEGLGALVRLELLVKTLAFLVAPPTALDHFLDEAGQLEDGGLFVMCQFTGEQARSEEHTSELQSLAYLVCRLLLEKKKNKTNIISFRLRDPTGSFVAFISIP